MSTPDTKCMNSNQPPLVNETNTMNKEHIDQILAGEPAKGQQLTEEEIKAVDAVLMRLSYRLRHMKPQVDENNQYSATFFITRDIGTIREVLNGLAEWRLRPTEEEEQLSR